ncbi:MAG: Tm-1-like ATP-binding domain-containing protein [Pirellulaceae bacterium]
MAVYLLATLDTKGHEADHLRQRLVEIGVDVILVDVGCLGSPQVSADIDRREVYQAAGESWESLVAQADRGTAVTAAAKGAERLIQAALANQQVDGVLSLGGSAGTTIGTAAMRSLPLGIPKLMISTLASGDVRGFVGASDILMLHSVVDIAGVNRISRRILNEAAAAMAGMVRFQKSEPSAADKPIIAATMFGVTTPCIEVARSVLEAAGLEVLVFHATGSGGQAMEKLIQDGLVAGVLDITTTEIADELVGGVLSAGPSRLTAAGRAGIPQVVSVGATDMVNFWALSTVPKQFADRQLYKHNDNITLMRTTAEECHAIGQDIGGKLSQARGPVSILLPANGVSAIDAQGQPFDNPAARNRLFDAVRNSLANSNVEVIERDEHINDASFAEFAAHRLIQLLQANKPF